MGINVQQIYVAAPDVNDVGDALVSLMSSQGRVVSEEKLRDRGRKPIASFGDRRCRYFVVHEDLRDGCSIVEAGDLAEFSLAAALSKRLRVATIFLGLSESTNSWCYCRFANGEPGERAFRPSGDWSDIMPGGTPAEPWDGDASEEAFAFAGWMLAPLTGYSFLVTTPPPAPCAVRYLAFRRE